MKIAILSLLMLAASHASAATQREQLAAVIAQIKAKPADAAPRLKAIALARKLKPAVPEDARRAFIRGNTAFTDAKSPEDFARAVSRFDEAATLAPWWSEAYFNLTKAHQAVGNYDSALDALKFYMAAASSAADKRQGQDLIYALEDKRDAKKAAADGASKAAAAEAGATASKAHAEGSIEGAWWTLNNNGGTWTSPDFVVVRKGDGFEVKVPLGTVDVKATETTLHITNIIDGKKISERNLHRQGDELVGDNTDFYNGQNMGTWTTHLMRKAWTGAWAP